MCLKIVGALTDKLYEFKNRCWELNISNTIDIYDSLGSNIKVYTYGSEVKRVLPLKNDLINEDWISNKTRYFFEGLVKWRLNIPLMKKKKIMVYVSWIQAFYFFFLKIWFNSFFYKSTNLIFVNSLFIDYELTITSKILMKKMCFLNLDKKNNININDYYLYFINPNFFDQIQQKKIFFFVGYNLRLEAPILNIKLRKKMLKEEVLYYSVGSIFNDNLNANMIGLNINNLLKYLQGKLKICNIILKKWKNNLKKINNDVDMFFIGNNIINRVDTINILRIITEKYNNNINRYISLNFYVKYKKYFTNFFIKYNKNINYYYIKEKNNIGQKINIMYMQLTTKLYDEFNLLKGIHNINLISKNDILYIFGIDFLKIKEANFIVFQGHHINLEYLKIDLIFPSITFLEKSSNFLNIEGNNVQTNFVLYPPNFCKNDWSILNAIYIYMLNFISKIYNLNLKSKLTYLNVNRFYISLPSIEKIKLVIKKMSTLYYFNYLNSALKYAYNRIVNINFNFIKIKKMYNNIVSNKQYNPFLVDIMCENSSILKFCSKFFREKIKNYQNLI